MTEFAYSEVLFAGDDGLPIEFNIQNTVGKESLKAIIEYGGGLCTLSDDGIYLVSPGTKVVNVDSSKKLISSRYVFDCVKENCLLDTDEYKIEINEMETSDFSDNSANLCENQLSQENGQKSLDDNNSIDIIGPNKNLSPNLLNCPSSNHDFDFQDSESRNNVIVPDKKSEPGCSHLVIPLQSSETHIIKFSADVEGKKLSETCVNAVPDSLEDFEETVNLGQNLLSAEVCDIEANAAVFDDKNENPVSNIRDSPISAVVVSSSQPNVDALDQFDNMILNEVQKKPVENDDCLSQSYTVSSSADAQVSPKPPSHHTSAEIFDGSSAAADSASQTTEQQKYIKNLEKEIEEILKKPSPKSIQDKIILVKYICIVKKLAPAVVLQTLQNF